MIDPKELRIGNYIQPKEGKDWWGYKFKSIQYIGHDGEFARESDMGQCDVVWNIKDADPIPITPEWLERLGFEKEKLKISGGVVYSLGDYMIIKSLGGKEYVDRYTFHHRFMAARFMREIEYIHQIQNIIHALTGHELTAKP